MFQLARFALLLFAILVIPWLATNAPPNLIWDSGWVQAIGSIGAIGVGIAYIYLQNRWQKQHREAQERELRRYFVNFVASALDDQDNTIALFESALRGGQRVASTLARDSQDIMGDELLATSAVACGSGTFAIQTRKAGFHAKAFAHSSSTAIANGNINPAALADMRKYREAVQKAANVMARLI